jgi:hypothetical protein
MTPLRSSPVVHLELHTGDLPQSRALYAQLCGWHPEWSRHEPAPTSRWSSATG